VQVTIRSEGSQDTAAIISSRHLHKNCGEWFFTAYVVFHISYFIFHIPLCLSSHNKSHLLFVYVMQIPVRPAGGRGKASGGDAAGGGGGGGGGNDDGGDDDLLGTGVGALD